MANPRNHKDLIYAVRDGKGRWFTKTTWDNMPENLSGRNAKPKYGWVQSQPPSDAVKLNEKLTKATQEKAKEAKASGDAETKAEPKSKSMQFNGTMKAKFKDATSKLKTIAEVEAFFGEDSRPFALEIKNARIEELNTELDG